MSDSSPTPWNKYIERSLHGDIHATRELVQLILLDGHIKWLVDDSLAHGLRDIFFSHLVSSEQKQLIWSVKDFIVYVDPPAKNAAGNGKQQGSKQNTVTFLNYLTSFCNSEMREYWNSQLA